MTKVFKILPVFLFCLAACDMAGVRLEETSPPPPDTSASPTKDVVSTIVLQPAYFEIAGTGKSKAMSLQSWDENGFHDWVGTSTVTWFVDDETVASVDEQGHVQTLALGETLIHARVTHQEKDQDAVAHIVVRAVPQEPPTDPEGGQAVADYPDEPLDTVDQAGPTVPPPPSTDCGPVASSRSDIFASRVVSYRTGPGGGFQEELLPDIVLGGPRGEGLYQGGYDVFSLGIGGEIVLEFAQTVCDGPGPDFTVFENAFRVGNFGTFVEPGLVSVSEDGMNFRDFPCALTTPYKGCAGLQPVLANVNLNDIDPTDPKVSGGDAFDLRMIGLTKARFVRIRDSGLSLGPPAPEAEGFDLDAVVTVNTFHN
jgi:hypothetical protein